MTSKTVLGPSMAFVVTFVFSSSIVLGDGELELPLWPHGAPGEQGDIGPETAETSGQPKPVTRVSNVTRPTITLNRPASELANGCGVVVCPGGGYNILAFDLEGTEVAQWLNSIGVTAVLLKYRVPRRDRDHPHVAPLQDAQRAIRLVRKHARDWAIDPARVGLLGFSAGGHLTVMAGTHWDRNTYDAMDEADKLSCRPDFLVPVYAAYLGDKKDAFRLGPLVRVTNRTPPTFLVVTYDDKDRGAHAALLFVQLKKAGVPAELHIYSRGGHGYGLRHSEDPVSSWPQRCEQWMRVSGLLTRQITSH